MCKVSPSSIKSKQDYQHNLQSPSLIEIKDLGNSFCWKGLKYTNHLPPINFGKKKVLGSLNTPLNDIMPKACVMILEG